MQLAENLSAISEALKSNKVKMEPLDATPAPLVVAWRGDKVIALITIANQSAPDDVFEAVAIAAEGYGADVIGMGAEILMTRPDTGETRDCLMTLVANRAGDTAVCTQPFHLASDTFGRPSLHFFDAHTSNSVEGSADSGSMISYMRSLMLDEMRPVPESFVQHRGTTQEECDLHTTTFLIGRFECVVMSEDDEGTLRLFVDADTAIDDPEQFFKD